MNKNNIVKIQEKANELINLLIERYNSSKLKPFIEKQKSMIKNFCENSKVIKWVALQLTRIEQDIKFGFKKIKKTWLYQKLAETFKINADYKSLKEFLKYKKYIAYFFAFWVVGLDQYLKFIAVNRVFFTDKEVIIPHILSLANVRNTGAAFGFLEQYPPIIIAISSIVAIALLIYLIRNTAKMTMKEQIFWGLIFGGIIGNLFDRLMFGYVIDVIKLEFTNFPIFNIADVAINVGVFMLIYTYYIRPYVKNGYKFAKNN